MNTIEETRLDMQIAYRAMVRDKLNKLEMSSATMREDVLLHACIGLAETLMDEFETALTRVARIAIDGASFNAGQRTWPSDIDDGLSDLRSNIIEYTRNKLMDYDADEIARAIDVDRRCDDIRDALMTGLRSAAE